MRLLFLNHNVAFSGTFFRSHQLAREMRRRGHDVTYVTTSRRARLRSRWREIDGVRTLEAPDLLVGRARTGWDGYNAVRRIGALWNERFDLIHGFDCRPAVIGPALALRRRTGARLVLDWADWWGRGGRIHERSGVLARRVVEPVETWFEEAFRTRADGSTVISRALAARLEGLGVAPERIVRAPNGSDGDRIRPEERSDARRALGVDERAPVVLHIGVLTAGDARLLMEAWSRVWRSRPDARLVMVGPAAPVNGAGGVIRTGFVRFERLKRWLGAADLAVIALRDTVGNRGRWPGKVNDHLAAGRATLMTRVGDAPGYLEPAGAGWAVDADAVALGDRMLDLLGDRDALSAAGENARRLAETELAWPRIADQVERVYEQ